MEKINRRKAVSLMSQWSAGTLLFSQWIVQGCIPTHKNSLFALEYQSLLALIVDYILPPTPDCPGAKEANVHEFIAIIVEECYDTKDRTKVFLGLSELLSKRFFEYSPQGQLEKVMELNALAESDSEHYFNQVKSLTEWGFFSSKIGITQGLRYNPLPGKYVGCVPYKGELAWY